MTQQPDSTTSRPVATPIVLLLIAAAHLAYAPIAQWRGFPIIAPALVASTLLAAGYAVTAWWARREQGFAAAIKLILVEDLGVLALGLLLGYPWTEYLRPASLGIIALQLALAFAEIVRRQEADRPIVPATRLAWFVLVYAATLAVYSLLRPTGLLRLASIAGLDFSSMLG
jgi:hypothetical protein